MTNEHPVAHRDRVLREGLQAWERLRTLLDSEQKRASLHSEGATAWSCRDVYAHFARYQSNGIQQLHRRLAGNEPLPPDGLDDDTRNEQWVAADRSLSFEQAREWCLATTRGLRDLLMALTAEQWAEFGADHGDDVLAPHYRSHIRYIETSGREGG